MASSVRCLLFSDIEGSTDLLRSAGALYPEMLNEHRRLVRGVLRGAGGVEHGTEGDSFFASFDSPSVAVAAAIGIQLGIESMDCPGHHRLRVRIGVHVGEVVDNDGDPLGLAVNHAARLASSAHGGQIVISDAVRAMLGELSGESELVALGTHRLRDVGQIPVFQVVGPGLQRTFPPLRHAVTATTNLAAKSTGFVGDATLLGDIEKMVGRSPLLTLTGPGGVGKTRLAVEYGWSQLSRFDDGVWLVELARLDGGSVVNPTIASTLSIRPQPDVDVIESIVDWLRGRHLLMILDNCEHLIESVRQLVGVLVARCPTLKLLVTSREPLGLHYETVHPVRVMDADREGVRLFVERASAADTSFVLSATDAPVVAEICRRLDGLPLAIELAAARVRSMAPAEMLVRLDDRFRLLRSGSHDRPDRHATARATVAWSYQLLSEDEQSLFDRLSVCAGMNLATAEVLGAGVIDDDFDVIELLRGLVDRSMIVAERQSNGTRYWMLETIREYGRQNLEARGCVDEMRQLHLDHFIGVAERADDLSRTAQQVSGTAIFAAEWDNLRAAHAYAVETWNLTLAERLISATRVFAFSMNRVEQADWVMRTLALASVDRQPHSDTFGQAAWWSFAVDDDDERASEFLLRGLELAPDLDSPEAALCLSMIDPGDELFPDAFDHFKTVASKLDLDREWWALVILEELSGRPAALDDSQSERRAQLVEVANRVRAPSLLFAADMALGHHTLLEIPDCAGALEHYRRAAAIAGDSGDARSEGEALRAIAFALALDDPTRGVVACRKALESLYDSRFWFRIWQMFDNVAYCLVHHELFEQAAVLVGFLESRPNDGSFEDHLGFRNSSRGAVHSHAELVPMVRRGASMTRHEIVAYALAALERFDDRS